MPLSKVKNRDRMREIRLHAKKKHAVVQPKPSIYIEEDKPARLDADGQPVYEP